MTVSVFLGGFGFGNLGDEACLATSLALFKADVNCAFSHDKNITAKAGSFDFYFNDIKEVIALFPRIDRVVIAGGGIGFNPSFKDNLDWALRCKKVGAEVVVHNIGIGKIGKEWALTWPYLVPVLAEAVEFSVRDYRSRAEVESWELGLHPNISFYPERHHPSNEKLGPLLSESDDFLGISMNNRGELWNVLADNVNEVRNILKQFEGHRVVPIVSVIHCSDSAEHDHIGFLRFAELFNLNDRVVARELCDYDFWLKNVGPADIKYLVGRCRYLISARKHNIIHAIGAGVPFMGVFEFQNDSISRVYHALYRELPKNSSLLPLYPQ